jgi:hypothetical protein
LGKLFTTLFLFVFLADASAQTASILADFTASTVPAHAVHSKQSFENAPKTQRENRRPSMKKAPSPLGSSKSWLTALYLRPVEDKIDRTVWPLVPALLLEAIPTHSVETPSGHKTVAALRKGDVLYRYNPTTHQVSTWEVGIVKRKSRRAESPNLLGAENGGFLFENRVAMDQKRSQ